MTFKKTFLKNKCFFFSSFVIIFFFTDAFFLLKKRGPKIVDKFEYIPNGNDDYFTTVHGSINILEIEKNVLEKFGYKLIKNDLIPILKKRNPQTCQNVFLEWQKIANEGLTVDPPRELPGPKAFLLNGYANSSKWYFNDTPKNEKEAIKIWNQTYIDDLKELVKRNASSINPTYSVESLAVHAATKHYNIKGQIGAIIGSLTPWVEVYTLVNGAKHVTTVDYQKILVQHSQMDFLYALDLVSQNEKYYNKFDFIVSFSSIEHSGLGRFGDPIDPIGDLREMNKIRCMLKPGGLLFIGIPVGPDAVAYNAHRVYGRIRLAMMFEGFRVLNVFFSETILQNESIRQTLNRGPENTVSQCTSFD